MALRNYGYIFCVVFFFVKQAAFSMEIKIQSATLTSKLKALVAKGFSEHSKEQVGRDGQIKPFCFIAYNNSAVAGVIFGTFFWDTLLIDRLYIFPNYRYQGIGKSLVLRALSYGKKNHCKYAFVETMNFQAVDFYKKLDFVVEFERFGFANNTSMYFLRKTI